MLLAKRNLEPGLRGFLIIVRKFGTGRDFRDHLIQSFQIDVGNLEPGRVKWVTHSHRKSLLWQKPGQNPIIFTEVPIFPWLSAQAQIFGMPSFNLIIRMDDYEFWTFLNKDKRSFFVIVQMSISTLETLQSLIIK